MLSLFAAGIIALMNATPASSLKFTSSDTRLRQAFEWAKKQALAYVNEGDPVGPWFEAALPGRHAFCMRDVSHQATGAQALGLEEHTYNMLHKFAKNIAASRDWCSFWEIDRLDRPAPVDYKNDQEFWYNLPANFDVMDTCYRMYKWTGDRRYIDNRDMLNFYRRTVTDYVKTWDIAPETVMQRTKVIKGAPYFRGDPSYDESIDDLVLGVDLLACQVAGYKSYAEICALHGYRSEAERYRQEAAKVEAIIEHKWWLPESQTFLGAMNRKHELSSSARWSVTYWNAISDPNKLRKAVDHLAAIPLDQDANQVEDKSYYPEILYRFGYSDKAYAQILDLTRPGRYRQEYPEVSYAMIGAFATGVMGVSALPGPKTVIQTLSGLTSNTRYAKLENLPIQGGQFTIRHDGLTKSTLTNQGQHAIAWRAAFPGHFNTCLVDGRSAQAHHTKGPLDRLLTSIDVIVSPGQTRTVNCH